MREMPERYNEFVIVVQASRLRRTREICKKKVSHKEHKDHQGKLVKG